MLLYNVITVIKVILFLDNTNVEQFEYKRYVQIANQFNYSIVFLRMSETNVDKLSKRNVHDVPRKSIEKMISKFKENPIPYCFQWQIPSSATRNLKDKLQNSIQLCAKADSRFLYFLSSMKTSPERIYQMFNKRNFSMDLFHITTAYTSEDKISPKASNLYTQSTAVQNSLGSVEPLKIIGLIMNSKCLAARVLLTDNQKKLWGRNDSLNFDEKRNPIAFENCRPFYLNRSKGKLDFQAPDGCLKPNHGIGCTAHITIGTSSGNRPVVAKDSVYRMANLEAYTNPDHEVSNPGCPAVRCYGRDNWVIYFRQAIHIDALFCGHYNHGK